jgi:DNA-binding transcriptional regulator YiaG
MPIQPSKDQVRQARSKAGLSQTAFGLIAGAKLRTVQAWESGERRMRAHTWSYLQTQLKGIKK